MQYTIIQEPAKNRWYPMWREKDHQEWQHFREGDDPVFRQSTEEAEKFIKQEEASWSMEFPVTSVTREDLVSMGFSREAVRELDDIAMRKIVSIMERIYCDREQGFWDDLMYSARQVLEQEEKDSETSGSTGTENI